MIEDLKARVIETVKGIFADKPDEEVYKWCERNFYVTSGERIGQLNTDITPWIREPLEYMCKHYEVTDLAFMFGSQLGKTLMLMLAKAYILVNQPRDILFVMPSRDEGIDYVKERWEPTVEACPPLLALKASGRELYTHTSMFYTAAWLNVVGSNSPSKLASRARGVVIKDEIDKYPDATKKETSATRNADKRSKTFSCPKRISASTPTTDYRGIYLDYLAGDQSCREVPCPHCGEYIELVFEQIKWSGGEKVDGVRDLDAVQRSAHYECQKCQGKIVDGHKYEMNLKGRWRPTNPKAPERRRSFTMPSWYALWADTSFGRTAVKYLEAKDSFNLQDFDTNERGMPYIPPAETVDWKVLAARREPYHLGTINDKIAVLTAFCDVQGSWLEWGVIGWGENAENWVVEHEQIIGDPSSVEVWEALEETILRKRALPLDWTFIDYGGHHGQRSIDFVKKMAGHRVYLHFGSKDINCPVNGRKTKTKKPIVDLYTTGVGSGKRWVMSALKAAEGKHGRSHFSCDLDDEYFQQLCAEQLKPEKIHGEEVFKWISTRARNEALDIHVGCYAGLKRLSNARLKRRFAELAARNKKGDGGAPVDDDRGPDQDLQKPVARGRRRGARRVVRPGGGFVGGF